MDHFESIVCTLLEFDGYWVRRGYKIKLTKEEKKRVERASMPRPEIDVLAFKPQANLIIAFEAKSYLDSLGVPLEEIKKTDKTPEGRYKMFTCESYRNLVLGSLQQDLIKKGMATNNTTIVLGLIAAKVHKAVKKPVRHAAPPYRRFAAIRAASIIYQRNAVHHAIKRDYD